MPTIVAEAGVVRSPAHSQGAGSRSPGAGEAASPFSELLESCEAPEAPAPESAAPPTEPLAPQVLPAEGKAVPPDGRPESAPGTDVAKAQAELVLAIVRPPGQTTPDTPARLEPTTLGATLSQAISNKPQPESETDAPLLPAPADADAADPAAVAQPAPPAAVVPPPAAIPASVEATDPAPAMAQAIASGTPDAAEANTPATTTPTLEAPASDVERVPATNAVPAPNTVITPNTVATTETAPAKLTVSSAPAAQTPGATAVANLAGAERSPQGEKLNAPAATTPSAEQTAPSSQSAGSELEAAAPKPAARSSETAANAAPRHTEPPSAPPSMTTAQTLPEIGANPGPLPPASAIASSAAPQPANPTAHESAAPNVPVAGLAVEIAAQAQTGKNRFEIRLDPPELGRIDVRLDVDSDGEVTTHLRVDRVETLDLLRRDAPALERALQQAGLRTSDNGLQFSLRDQAFSQHNQGRETPAMARLVVPDEQLVPAETQRHYGRLAGLGRGVDIRV